MEATNSDINIFVEKYKPTSIDDVIGSDNLKMKFKEIIETKELNNMIFSGCQGSGKTLSAKIIANEVSEDVHYINASDKNGIDVIRTEIKEFCDSNSFSDGYKIVILDEADYISVQGQAALRGVIEQYISSCRFIFTCNFLNKIMKPIHSRCELFEFVGGNKADMVKRCLQIIKKEGVTGGKEDLLPTLKKLVIAKYPDFRAVLNTLQKLVVMQDGKKVLLPYSSLDDDINKIIEYIKDKDLTSIRKFIKEKGIAYDDIFRFVFDNADKINPNNKSDLILTCNEYQKSAAFVADPEINVCSFFVDVMALDT